MPTTTPQILSGVVFVDSNANGTRDLDASGAFEAGVPGVTVTAYDASGSIIGRASTDDGGTYALPAFVPGPYLVEFSGWDALGYQTGPHGADNGTPVQFVPRPDGRMTASLALTSEQAICEALIACASAPVEIGHSVWMDLVGNGIEVAPGSQARPIVGATVDLYSPSGSLLGTTVTDATGQYYFSSGLTANTDGYLVRLDNPVDYQAGGPLAQARPTQPFAGTDPLLSSKGVVGVDGFPEAAVATGPPGSSQTNVDFGFVLTPASAG
jgi:hypothetical protein